MLASRLSARRWSARLLLAVIVGLLCSSLVAAEARADTGLLERTIVSDVGGAVRGAAPSIVRAGAAEVAETVGTRALAGLICATGVGCVVMGVATVATIAYGTKDMWLPLVDKWLHPNSTPNMPQGDTVVDWVTPPTDGMHSVSFRQSVRDAGSIPAWGGYADALNWKWECSNGFQSTGTVQRTFDAGGGNFPKDTTVDCTGNGGTVVGISVARTPINYDGARQAPDEIHGWGHFTPSATATVESRITCKNEADGTMQVLTADANVLADPGLRVKVCPAGTHPVSAEVLSGPDPSHLTSQGTTALSSPSDETNFPACVSAGTVSCTYSVKVNGQTCHTGDPGCVQWTRYEQTHPGASECWFGPYKLPLADCAWLERAYDPDGGTATVPNTDGNPDTYTEPGPQSDPQPSPSPSPTADPSPTVTMSQSAPPTVSETPAPSGSPTTGATPDPKDPQPNPDSSCWGGMVSWNPADWVLTPVKCALSWAFVPGDVGQKVTDWWDVNKGNMMKSPLGKWWAAFGAWGTAFSVTGAGSGCEGPALPTGFLGHSGWISRNFKGVMPAEIHPWNACTGAQRVAATTVNALLTVSIGFFSGWRLVRIVGSPFGYSLDLMNGRGLK